MDRVTLQRDYATDGIRDSRALSHNDKGQIAGEGDIDS
jgi:hypothetical protein